jgi:uncharacterized membrane protein YkoI
MRRIFGGLGVSALFGLVLMAATARSGGDKAEKITQDKLPKKVLDAVKSWFPEPDFTSITKETTDGKVAYDLEFKYKGRKYEMDIKEDGTVLEIEKEVAVKDLPEAVAKALKAKHAKATIKDIMEVNLVTGKNLKLDHYEVILEMDGKTIEVTVSPDGKKVEGGAAEKKEKQ